MALAASCAHLTNSGCNDDEEALHLLDACDMNVEHAVQLFFDSVDSATRPRRDSRGSPDAAPLMDEADSPPKAADYEGSVVRSTCATVLQRVIPRICAWEWGSLNFAIFQIIL